MNEGLPKKPTLEVAGLPNSTALEKLEMQKSAEELSERARNATLRLTKIAHLLFPKNVPDIVITSDGKNFERDGKIYRVPEDDGQSDTNEVSGVINKQIISTGSALEEAGLMLREDTFTGSYVGGTDAIQYVRTFIPWELRGAPPKLELLFDPTALTKTLERRQPLSDEDKVIAQEHIKEILRLADEEQVESLNSWKENLRDCTEEVAEIETLLGEYEKPEVFARLNATETEQDANNLYIRQFALETRRYIFEQLKTLQAESDITPEKHAELESRMKVLQKAVGVINRGMVDHTR